MDSGNRDKFRKAPSPLRQLAKDKFRVPIRAGGLSFHFYDVDRRRCLQSGKSAPASPAAHYEGWPDKNWPA